MNSWIKLNLRWVTALTHWGRVTHICVSKLPTIGTDNGVSPRRHQTIIWTNAVILLIRTLGTNFNESAIEIFIHENPFQKVAWKMAAILSRPQCVNIRGCHTHSSLVRIVAYTSGLVDRRPFVKMDVLAHETAWVGCPINHIGRLFK